MGRQDRTTHVFPSSPLTHILRTRERANDLERKDLKAGRRERKMCCPSGRKHDKGGWSTAVKVHCSCSQKTQSTYVESGGECLYKEKNYLEIESSQKIGVVRRNKGEFCIRTACLLLHKKTRAVLRILCMELGYGAYVLQYTYGWFVDNLYL